MLHQHTKKRKEAYVKEDKELQQYIESKERVRHLRKTIYKVHPKWKRRRIVRLILLAIFMICLILVGYYTLKEPRGALMNVPYQERDTYIYKTSDYIIQLIFMEMIVFLIPGLIYIFYCCVLRGSCRDGIEFKDEEVLIMSDTELRNFYCMRGKSRNLKWEVDFPYTDIKRIVWNECQQRFEIYGISTCIQYIDYASDKVDSRIKDEDNLKEAYRIQWVYPIDKLEEFKNELTKATGLQVELTTEATE